MTYAASLAHSRKWQDVEAEVGLRVDAQEYRGETLRRQLSPRFNVRYDVSSNLRAYASWGRFSQAQRVYEWRTEAGQDTADRAALATHSILGVTYDRAGSWRLTGEVYRKHWPPSGRTSTTCSPRCHCCRICNRIDSSLHLHTPRHLALSSALDERSPMPGSSRRPIPIRA